MDDAVNAALRDQERAGIDMVTDGEMRRWYFVQGFYGRFTGLDGAASRCEPPASTATTARHATAWRSEITVPTGLGIVDEYRYLVQQTDRAIKTTCPGPLTLTIHMQTRRATPTTATASPWPTTSPPSSTGSCTPWPTPGCAGSSWTSRSYSIVPGETTEWITLYNTAVAGDPRARGAPRACTSASATWAAGPGRRRYRWMFPDILEAAADQIVLEFANREMIELDLLAEIVNGRQGRRRRRRRHQVLLRRATGGSRRAGPRVPAARPAGAA